jgi:MFS family permease
MHANLKMADPAIPLVELSRMNTRASRNPSEEAKPGPDIPNGPKAGGGPASWADLPRKGQLFILFLCRFADFLQIASIQTYIFYQLKNMDSTATDAQVSNQAGIVQGVFTGAQVLTAVLWGRAADARWCGRKMVIVIGILGTAVSCVGYGLARTFFWAVFWRAFGGAVNGIVGIMSV